MYIRKAIHIPFCHVKNAGTLQTGGGGQSEKLLPAAFYIQVTRIQAPDGVGGGSQRKKPHHSLCVIIIFLGAIGGANYHLGAFGGGYNPR